MGVLHIFKIAQVVSCNFTKNKTPPWLLSTFLNEQMIPNRAKHYVYTPEIMKREGAIVFFLTAIWLPNGQLWAIIEEKSHSADVNHCILHFRPKGHREPRNEVGSLSA